LACQHADSPTADRQEIGATALTRQLELSKFLTADEVEIQRRPIKQGFTVLARILLEIVTRRIA
jgi:hypothetical protein